MRALLIAAAALALTAGAAEAQLPSLPTDSILPTGPILDAATGPVRDVVKDAGDLKAARKLRLDALIKAHPDLIDVDRAGAPVVRSEAVAISPDPEALAQARREGFETRTETLGGLGLEVVVLRAPAGMSTRQAVARLRKIDPDGVYDFNHLYEGSGEAAPGKAATPATAKDGEAAGRVGLIDGGLDLGHPAFAGAKIVAKGFKGGFSPSAHGTATAGLLLAAAPGSELLAADVYGARPTGGSADAIIKALSFMAQERVRVVNVSLVGPANKTMEKVIAAALAKGVTVVAAVGNDGPAAPPLYPAAYAGVIGVTAVDRRDKALAEAARGPQVDFAAPGAEIAAPAPGGGYAAVRGTSFAAPIVAGLLARKSAAALAAGARDLGAKGRDRTYGAGLVGADLRGTALAAR